MKNTPLLVHDWNNAILHIDADAFFAACEQATNPSLQGKPVVVGRERGIVTAASYEAKRRGIRRGMRLSEVKKVCPEAILITSDYEKYSLFSFRLMEILRRFSPLVEPYSIDEAFVDLTGLRRPFHASYEELGLMIKTAVRDELGITVSVGISLTKTLAKIASRHQKPDGLTLIPGRQIHHYLSLLPVGEVWGIGPNTAAWCAKLGIHTALDLARKPAGFIQRHFSKPFYEIWQELNGTVVYPVNPQPKTTYLSISKARTFPPTSDRLTVFAHLSNNLEDACFKARRYQLAPRRLVLFLRTQEFKECAVELKLTTASAYPPLLTPFFEQGFNQLFQDGVWYRQTGVILTHLVPAHRVQPSLFDDPVRLEKIARLYQAVDRLKVQEGLNILTDGLAPSTSPPVQDRLSIPVFKIQV
ncbi:MAG: DNA polymerase IV [candidate division WOR-3 bacterium]|jgi:DNA polymerase-4/DNA polymerase V|nr:DNA polymerase IV [candidate division WOR-3 bacterium]MCR4424122.1 DNA polymerase IV [candidate division WOR-3 bacterium]MDH7519459.1 DNA polymerase IV [bacterium]